MAFKRAMKFMKFNRFHTYFMVFICIVIAPALNCSFSKHRELNTQQKIPEFKKGDIITIILQDKTQMECTFIEQLNGKIVVGFAENGKPVERSLEIETIDTIKKLNRPPNKIMLVAVGLAALSLFIWASYYVVLGQSGVGT